MAHSLPGLGTRLRKTCQTDDAVEAPLAEQKHLRTCIPLGMLRLLEDAAELSLAEAVVIFDLLFLSHRLAVGRELSHRRGHAGSAGAAVERLGGAGALENQCAESAIDAGLRTCVA